MTNAKFIQPQARRAILTLSVLVSLAVVMSLYMAWARTLVLQRQQAAAELDRVQAEFLALSAIDRAHARLQNEPEFQGEVWRIEPFAAQLPTGGSAEIKVEAIEGRPQDRRITVDARYPTRGARLVRHRQAMIITLSQPGDAS